jgi:hypothetical protein
MKEWIAALPRQARPKVPHTTGLDAAFLFPSVPVQVATVTLLFETLGTRSVRRIADGDQYREPWVSDLHSLRMSTPRRRPVGPYLLIFRSRGLPPETVGVAPDILTDRFREAGHTGLTIPEYLVLQRLALEAWGDHRFDAPDTRAGPQAQWLLDAGAPGEHVAAQWRPPTQRLELRFVSPAAADAAYGAHPTVVVPL